MILMREESSQTHCLELLVIEILQGESGTDTKLFFIKTGTIRATLNFAPFLYTCLV